MKTVIVVWEDIIDIKPGQWLDLHDALQHEYLTKSGTFTVETLGFLMEENDDYILMCSSKFTDNSQVNNLSRIPRGCIKSITDIDIHPEPIKKVSMKR